MSCKALVIGLDCATFKLIKPFSEQGLLPNLSRIMERGVIRILKSTHPPISPPAWTTFLTGRNPGQHGIFHFVDIDVSQYSLTQNRLINSSLFSGRTFIDLIGNHGLRVGAVKIPFTYPPWKVNGFMVAGEPSPDWKRAHTYPPELAREIGVVNLGSATDFMRCGTDELLEHLMFDCDVRTKIARSKLEEQTFDFFMVVHNVTDAAVHRLWKFTDSSCPNYCSSFQKHRHILRDIYIKVDTSIGQILEKIGEDTTVFFMSDHGATRRPLYLIHTNAWLKEHGYLHTKGGKSLLQDLYKTLVCIKDTIPSSLRQLIVQAINAYFLNRFSTFQTLAANFDWASTRAYAVNLYSSLEGIVLNLKGRQPNGIVSPGHEAEMLCDEIRSGLMDIKDPVSRRQIVQHVYRRDEVYHGVFSERMPDLIVQYHLDYRGGKSTEQPLVTNVPASEFDFESGCHDEDGIFIATGPHIRNGQELQPAPIVDMAATILYTMGLPVPEYMDGQVMLDIFDEDFVTQNPVRRVTTEDTALKSYDLSAMEEAEMKQQLKGLGYM